MGWYRNKWKGCETCGKRDYLVYPTWVRIGFTLPCYVCEAPTEWLQFNTFIGDGGEYSNDFKAYVPYCKERSESCPTPMA